MSNLVSSRMSDFPCTPNFTAIVIVSAVSSLVGLAMIIGFAYYCAKIYKGVVLSGLQAAVAPPAVAPAATSGIRVWEIEAPTMERFLQEVAVEKPVRFRAQQLNGFTSNYSTSLGAGGFGVVYKGQFPNGVKIAVKVLNRSLSRTAEEQFMAEIATIGRTYHRNLVKLYGFCYDQFMSALVYEFMEKDNYLFNNKHSIKWETLHDIAIGTIKGIAYLHEECQERIIHYDIKPANILIDENFFPKVADFGLAKLCNRDNTHVSISGYKETLGYSAPEFMLKNYPITYKCDVYSFGIVLFEIIERRKNTTISPSENLYWFPKYVWEAFEKNELSTMTLPLEIEEKDREKVIKMCMICFMVCSRFT